MNTFRIEGTITTDLEPEIWWRFFYNFLGIDEFKNNSDEKPLFPNGEDLIELSKQETNYEIM